MVPNLSHPTEQQECGCDKCKLNGWKTVTWKTYAKHRTTCEQNQFSAEFHQFLQDSGSSTQIPEPVGVLIPSTSALIVPSTSSRNQSPIMIGDLSIDVSMMSLDDGKSEDDNDENEDDRDKGDEGSGALGSKVGDMSIYVGDNNSEVHIVPSPPQNIYSSHSQLPSDAVDEECSPHLSPSICGGDNDNFEVWSMHFFLQSAHSSHHFTPSCQMVLQMRIMHLIYP